MRAANNLDDFDSKKKFFLTPLFEPLFASFAPLFLENTS